MKVNNIIKATGIISIFLFFSCEKDFLNKNPLDQVSSQTFWKSEGEVQMALAGCYDRLRGGSGNWGGFPTNYQGGYLDGLADIAYVYWGLFNISDMSRGNISSNSEMPNLVYRNCYRGIATCNFFLGNVDKATTVDASKINIYKGEIRFLRGLFYFNLVQFFGGVPLFKESPVDPESTKIKQSTKNDVLAFVMEDLDYAISVLPDNAYKGHAVKGSAMGIKTRVLLFEEKWTEAATLTQQIISSGKFSIFNDYERMFLTKGQVNNPEVMFSCRYLESDWKGGTGNSTDYAAAVFLRKSLQDAYECSDGLPISESPLYNASNPYVNRDPRLSFTIRNPSSDWDYPGTVYYPYDTFNPTGVENRKGVDTTVSVSVAYVNDRDWILLRYADILLMYAEAKNEASGPDASVYKAINEVRARPGVDMPPVNQVEYNTKDLVRDYIRNERKVELALEGLRYFDLKRWHIAHTLLPTVDDADGKKLVFEQRQYLWPFPQIELDNNKNLIQNPGY